MKESEMSSNSTFSRSAKHLSSVKSLCYISNNLNFEEYSSFHRATYIRLATNLSDTLTHFSAFVFYFVFFFKSIQWLKNTNLQAWWFCGHHFGLLFNVQVHLSWKIAATRAFFVCQMNKLDWATQKIILPNEDETVATKEVESVVVPGNYWNDCN